MLSRPGAVLAAFALVVTGCSGAMSRAAPPEWRTGPVLGAAAGEVPTGDMAGEVALGAHGLVIRSGTGRDARPRPDPSQTVRDLADSVRAAVPGQIAAGAAAAPPRGSASGAAPTPPAPPAPVRARAVDPAVMAALRAVDAWPSDRALAPGDEGPDVLWVQRRLVELDFSTGEGDGHLGEGTLASLWALQKLAGLPTGDVVDAQVWRVLRDGVTPTAWAPQGEPTRAEVDLDRQVMTVWVGGRVALITHVSTGSGEGYCQGGRCRKAVTSPGDYRITRRISGWRNGPLGSLYNPLYFNGGVAIHGSNFVPTWPDSHGCVRVPMHVADQVPALLPNGTPVHVVRPSELAAQPAQPVPPAPVTSTSAPVAAA